MDLFSNVGNVQKSIDYSQTKQQTHNLESTKLENIEKTTKNKEDKEIIEHHKKITKEELQNLTQKLNKEMEPLNPDIKFHYNDRVNELVVNVIDKNTDKVIRKIPSDEALKIMEKMRELVGALFDDKG